MLNLLLFLLFQRLSMCILPKPCYVFALIFPGFKISIAEVEYYQFVIDAEHVGNAVVQVFINRGFVFVQYIRNSIKLFVGYLCFTFPFILAA